MNAVTVRVQGESSDTISSYEPRRIAMVTTKTFRTLPYQSTLLSRLAALIAKEYVTEEKRCWEGE